MEAHKADLVDTAFTLIDDAIDKFKVDTRVDVARRDMFAIERLPKGAAKVTSINLSIALPNGQTKNFPLNVGCEQLVMLLLKVNYYVLHALALIGFATGNEPVDAFVDQFNDYNDEKESAEVSGKYCRNGVKARRELATGNKNMPAMGGGAKKTAAQKKATTAKPNKKKKASPATTAAAAKKKNAPAKM